MVEDTFSHEGLELLYKEENRYRFGITVFYVYTRARMYVCVFEFDAKIMGVVASVVYKRSRPRRGRMTRGRVWRRRKEEYASVVPEYLIKMVFFVL